MEAWPVGWFSSGRMRRNRRTCMKGSTLDNGWPSHGRLLKCDASPPVCDGYVREKDAGSAHSSAIGATQDTPSRRPVLSGGRGFAFQQPLGRASFPNGQRRLANSGMRLSRSAQPSPTAFLMSCAAPENTSGGFTIWRIRVIFSRSSSPSSGNIQATASGKRS